MLVHVYYKSPKHSLVQPFVADRIAVNLDGLQPCSSRSPPEICGKEFLCRSLVIPCLAAVPSIRVSVNLRFETLPAGYAKTLFATTIASLRIPHRQETRKRKAQPTPDRCRLTSLVYACVGTESLMCESFQ
jgi:hypothetical protein